uniref:SRCR domain-containing protein n=1 Tax=Knipowitschia caucasica TaxID=637954 RepID=A0AAV2KP42_KNICA
MYGGVLAEHNSSEDLRLEGGASRCVGTVQLRRNGSWSRGIGGDLWTFKDSAAVCRDLDCGSILYSDNKEDFPQSSVWRISSDCVKSSAVKDCSSDGVSSSLGLEVRCSDSVRLVGGSGLCSGSLQIWDQFWISVCEGALDQRGTEVLCRELGCGAPSVLQGKLSPLGQTFHCEGHESALMDCSRSRPKTCSSESVVNITCSVPLRLVGGASRCAGTVELQHNGEWRHVISRAAYDIRVQGDMSAVCRDLDCGFLISGDYSRFPDRPAWYLTSACARKSSVRDCVVSLSSTTNEGLQVVCSDSLRLVGGSGLCSGSLQIWDQSWISVCEGALDQRGTEVLCRELGCGDPSVLQGELSPLKQTFHCEGHESSLMDCPRSRPKTCSYESAVNIRCSEPLRLVGGASRCAGTVELRHKGEWRKVVSPFGNWIPKQTETVCKELDCGSAVSEEKIKDGTEGGWLVFPDCMTASTCSVKPQFSGGSFQLLSPTGNQTLPAVNHSAHFLFNHTGPAHKGDYTCVYHLQVFNHNFSSESERLELRLGVSDSALIIRVLLNVVLHLLYILPMSCYYCKVRARGGAGRAELL